MKFPYYKLPAKPTPAFPDRKSILCPLIPITLENNDKLVDCLALIDSGAGCCLFPADFGERLGLEIKKGKTTEIHGIGGSKITAYFHRITLVVGGLSNPSYVGFTYDPLPAPALGQIGFFDLFKVTFDLKKERIELKPYKFVK